MYVFLLDVHSRFSDFLLSPLFIRGSEYPVHDVPLHVTSLESVYEILVPKTILLEENVEEWALVLCNPPGEELERLKELINIKHPRFIFELHVPPSGVSTPSSWEPDTYFLNDETVRSELVKDEANERFFRIVLHLDVEKQ